MNNEVMVQDQDSGRLGASLLRHQGFGALAMAYPICFRDRRHSRRQESLRPACVRGQALILFIVALLVLCVGVVVLFNTDQAVGKKEQLVNTADAAAYSVAVQQARAYNLMSYMNRAIVANEVAVAQMVSWYSWSNYIISGTDHIRKGLWPVRIVLDVLTEGGSEAIFKPLFTALKKAKQLMVKGRDFEQKAFDAALAVVANMNGAYASAERMIRLASPVDSTFAVARDVVRKNDAHAYIPAMGKVLLGMGAKSAWSDMQPYCIPDEGSCRDHHGGDRLKNVVMEARDPFSRQRSGSILFGFITKKGGTDLVDYQHWVGLDTLDARFPDPFCFGFCDDFKIPLAWGGGAAVDKKSKSFPSLARRDKGWDGPYQGHPKEYADKGQYDPYDGALDNGKASSLVLSEPAQEGDPWLKPYGGLFVSRATVGLPDYVDIKQGKATVPYDNGHTAGENGVKTMDVGPVFTVLVAQDMDSVRTSSHIIGADGKKGLTKGRLAVTDQTIDQRLTAMSSAQVYFDRPRRLIPRMFGKKREVGSLFSPYWQARRVDTPCAARQLVAAKHATVAPCP